MVNRPVGKDVTPGQTTYEKAVGAGTQEDPLVPQVGFPSGSFADHSIASLSGGSETLVAADADRIYLLIQNTGNANIGVNLVGGTAAIGGAGTFTLAAGDSYEPSGFVPTNAITVIGTSGQPVACVTAGG